MFDYINRFTATDIAGIDASFEPLLGPNWRAEFSHKTQTGDGVLSLFMSRLKEAGAYAHVVAAPIPKTHNDRTHFCMVYGTRAYAGLKVFRDMQFKAMEHHDVKAAKARAELKTTKTGQSDLFAPQQAPDNRAYTHVVRRAKSEASTFIEEQIRRRPAGWEFKYLAAMAMEQFQVRETDVKDICEALAKSGLILATWKNGHSNRKPKEKDLIRLAG
jgi:hypothetical protein